MNRERRKERKMEIRRKWAKPREEASAKARKRARPMGNRFVPTFPFFCSHLPLFGQRYMRRTKKEENTKEMTEQDKRREREGKKRNW